MNRGRKRCNALADIVDEFVRPTGIGEGNGGFENEQNLLAVSTDQMIVFHAHVVTERSR